MLPSNKARPRRREARLQRQSDVSAYDEFEEYRAQATGRYSRLTSRRLNCGGSLPSVNVEESVDMDHVPTAALGASAGGRAPEQRPYLNPHDGQLSVPLSPLIQRSHSTGNCGNFYPVSPKSPTKMNPNRFFTSVKNKLEECDQSSSEMTSQKSRNTSLDVPTVSKCPSAPHSRSNSFKRKKTKETNAPTGSGGGSIQERTTSMPSISKNPRRPSNLPLNALHLHPSSADSAADEFERVRNFMTSRKGIINCGDSFRRSNSSLRSAESWGSCDDAPLPPSGAYPQHRSPTKLADPKAVPLHRVLILGGPGVGKTTLAQQFITSDCLVNVEVIGGTCVRT